MIEIIHKCNKILVENHSKNFVQLSKKNWTKESKKSAKNRKIEVNLRTNREKSIKNSKNSITFFRVIWPLVFRRHYLHFFLQNDDKGFIIPFKRRARNFMSLVLCQLLIQGGLIRFENIKFFLFKHIHLFSIPHVKTHTDAENRKEIWKLFFSTIVRTEVGVVTSLWRQKWRYNLWF